MSFKVLQTLKTGFLVTRPVWYVFEYMHNIFVMTFYHLHLCHHNTRLVLKVPPKAATEDQASRL